MGLDMYLYRIKRLNEQELNSIEPMDYNTLCEKFNVREWDDEDDVLLGQIKQYITFIKRPVKQIDLNIAKKICGIPEDAQYYSEITNCEIWFFKRKNDDKLYKVDYWKCSEKQREQMTVTNILTLGIFHEEEIFYWRKNYELQGELYKYCDVPILNTGYYILNDKMKKRIIKNLEQNEDFFNEEDFESTEDSVVCYHEWY